MTLRTVMIPRVPEELIDVSQFRDEGNVKLKELMDTPVGRDQLSATLAWHLNRYQMVTAVAAALRSDVLGDSLDGDYYDLHAHMQHHFVAIVRLSSVILELPITAM